MKQILVITRTFREAAEDMRTLQGWILKYTVLKMGIEPHRGRITTKHAEVIFTSTQNEEKLLGRRPDAICKRTYLDNNMQKSFEAKKTGSEIPSGNRRRIKRNYRNRGSSSK